MRIQNHLLTLVSEEPLVIKLFFDKLYDFLRDAF